MSKSAKKEILASEYSSEQVLAVHTTPYSFILGGLFIREFRVRTAVLVNVCIFWPKAKFSFE